MFRKSRLIAPEIGVHGRGLSAVSALGPLERETMDLIWGGGFWSAQAVHEALAEQRPRALSTVQSTLDRLHRKRLLCRCKKGRAFVYEAAVSRQDLINSLVAELVNDLSAKPAGLAVCHALTPKAESRPGEGGAIPEETLQRLEAWIAACRKNT